MSFEDIGILKRLWENAERRVEDVQGRAVSWVQLVPAVKQPSSTVHLQSSTQAMGKILHQDIR